MDDTVNSRRRALEIGRPSGGTWRRALLGAPTAWLVALAACVALVLLALARPTPSTASDPPLLADRAPASDVERAFSGMTPFSVQPHMGASSGKDATCSIYSDGNLDTGVRVTWAVTLCTVHSTGAGPAG
jgi:hypothetical protein